MRILRTVLLLLLALGMLGCAAGELITAPAAMEGSAFSSPILATDAPQKAMPTESPVDEDGVYDSRDEVALYLHLFGHLPANYITKKEAKALGWNSGGLEKYAPGKCIGGDRFGNYEGLLPDGVSYHECDIDTLGAKSRGAKRIVYGDNGAIYYTDDHYKTFTELYGGD